MCYTLCFVFAFITFLPLPHGKYKAREKFGFSRQDESGSETRRYLSLFIGKKNVSYSDTFESIEEKFISTCTCIPISLRGITTKQFKPTKNFRSDE